VSDYAGEIITPDALYELIQGGSNSITIGTELPKTKPKLSKHSVEAKLLRDECLKSGDIFVINRLSDIKLKLYFKLHRQISDEEEILKRWFCAHYADISSEFKQLFNEWEDLMKLPYIAIWCNEEVIMKKFTGLKFNGIGSRVEKCLKSFDPKALKGIVEEILLLSKKYALYGHYLKKSNAEKLPDVFMRQEKKNLEKWRALEKQAEEFISQNEKKFKKIDDKMYSFKGSLDGGNSGPWIDFLGGAGCDDSGLFYDLAEDIASNKMVVTNDTGRSLEELQKLYPHASVHWVSYYSIRYPISQESDDEYAKANDLNLLSWEKSLGDVSALRDYFACSANAGRNLNSQQNIKIISADSGVGKTTFIKHHANAFKEANPTFWVSTIDLNNNFTKDDFLSYICDNSNLAKSLWHAKAQYMPNTIALFFDNIDALGKEEKNNAINFIRHLRKLNIENITITTKPNLSRKLEDRLQTLSYKVSGADFWSWHELKDLLRKFAELIGSGDAVRSIMENARDADLFINYVDEKRIDNETLTLNKILKFYKYLEKVRFKAAGIEESSEEFYRKLFGNWALYQLALEFKSVDTSKKMPKEVPGIAYQDKRHIVINKNLVYYYAAIALLQLLEDRKGDAKILRFLQSKMFLKENVIIYNLIDQIVAGKSDKVTGYWEKVKVSKIDFNTGNTETKLTICLNGGYTPIYDTYLEINKVGMCIIPFIRRVAFDEVIDAFLEADDKESFVLNPKWDVSYFLNYLSRKEPQIFAQLNFESIFLRSLKESEGKSWLDNTGIEIICLSKTFTIDMYRAVKDNQILTCRSLNYLLGLFENTKAIDQESLLDLCYKCIDSFKETNEIVKVNACNFEAFLKAVNRDIPHNQSYELLANLLVLSRAKIINMENSLLLLEPESGFSYEFKVVAHKKERFLENLKQECAQCGVLQ
jgi:hypothetical protein